MPAFQYPALTQVGEVVRGSPEASSLVEVDRRVEHGLIAIEAATATSEAGFTLVEMLVVITIIGLVMALVGPRVLSDLCDSKEKAAKIQIESFSAALDLYYLDNGAYPTASESLTAIVQRPSSAAAWNGPYLRTRLGARRSMGSSVCLQGSWRSCAL